jgi:predicted DNA-binding ribbon-helix-helix protein
VANFASFLRVSCLHWLANQEVHAAQVATRRSMLHALPEENAAVVA